MTTPTPPAACPICGAGVSRNYPSIDLMRQRQYACTAVWVHGSSGYDHDTMWFRACPHAQAAALRAGATLLPSPRETATAALVAATVAETLAHQALGNLNMPDTQAEKQAQATARLRWIDATAERIAAVAAFLATEPQP